MSLSRKSMLALVGLLLIGAAWSTEDPTRGFEASAATTIPAWSPTEAVLGEGLETLSWLPAGSEESGSGVFLPMSPVIGAPSPTYGNQDSFPVARDVLGPPVGVATLSSLLGGTPPSSVPIVQEHVKCMCCEEDGARHRFWAGTEGCDVDGGPFCWGSGSTECAACGGTSDCHADWDDGPCHVECSPELNYVAAIDESVTRFVEELRAGAELNSGPAVRRLLDEDPRLEYSSGSRALELADCEGEIVAEWSLPPEAKYALRIEADM